MLTEWKMNDWNIEKIIFFKVYKCAKIFFKRLNLIYDWDTYGVDGRIDAIGGWKQAKKALEIEKKQKNAMEE